MDAAILDEELLTSLIESYAETHGQTYEQAMYELSTRDSLEVGASLIGALPLVGNYTAVRPAVIEFGEYLKRHGYNTPKLWSNTDMYVIGGWSGLPRDHSPKTATRKEYPTYRKDGMTRNDIARKLGMNPKTLYRLLEQWGLKEKEKEREVLATWMG